MSSEAPEDNNTVTAETEPVAADEAAVATETVSTTADAEASEEEERETDPNEPLYVELNAESEATELESMCMQCGENGITRLLLTDIPLFRKVIIMAFQCDHCGNRNSSLQSGGSVQDRGISYSVRIETPADLNREVVRNLAAEITVPELELVIPPISRGILTTVESIIQTAIDDLSAYLPERMIQDPERTPALIEFIARLRGLLTLNEPWTFVLTDPSGNSFVENPHAPDPDKQMKVTRFFRTREQNESLGLSAPRTAAEGNGMEGAGGAAAAGGDAPVAAGTGRVGRGAAIAEATKNMVKAGVERATEFHALTSGDNAEDIPDEVIVFPEDCPVCYATSDMKMMMTDIPHFKEVMLFAFLCDGCGYRSTEVKTGGEMSETGERITLHVTCADDLSRDVLKSNHASVAIPEINLEVMPGTLGGKFTTVEGLLNDIKRQLTVDNPFTLGDSAPEGQDDKWQEFFAKLDALLTGEVPFTLIVDDALASSFVQSLTAPDPDPQLEVESYERTEEQNDDLGLTDMVTENYYSKDEEVDEAEAADEAQPAQPADTAGA